MRSGVIMSLFVTVAIACALAFGGIAHEIIPHTHSAEQGASTVLMHAALRHEDKKIVVIPIAIFFIFAIVASAAALFIPRALALYALSATSHDTESRRLRRGILAYRTFG